MTSIRLSHSRRRFQLSKVRLSYLWNATRRSTVPPPETNGYRRDSRCGRSGTVVGTGLRGCSTNARASSILRGLRRVTWAVTGYDDDDAGFTTDASSHSITLPSLSRPELRRCQAESTMAESTRTFLTPDRLKSAIEVMPLRSPRRRRARAGRRAGRQGLPPTHAVDHGITNGTVFAAEEAACVWLMASSR
jgi:hypothetical protein